MSADPLQDTEEAIDQRIAELAYRIWEEEGKPEGREIDHWLHAKERIKAKTDDSPTPTRLEGMSLEAQAQQAPRK